MLYRYWHMDRMHNSCFPVTRTHNSADNVRKLLAFRNACNNAALWHWNGSFWLGKHCTLHDRVLFLYECGPYRSFIQARCYPVWSFSPSARNHYSIVCKRTGGTQGSEGTKGTRVLKQITDKTPWFGCKHALACHLFDCAFFCKLVLHMVRIFCIFFQVPFAPNVRFVFCTG